MASAFNFTKVAYLRDARHSLLGHTNIAFNSPQGYFCYSLQL
jgi:hypothetical protein